MKKLDVAGTILNIILGIFYIPYSFLCYLSPMGYENIEIKNEVFAFLFQLFAFGMIFICAASIIASVLLRNKGKSKFSFFIQFVPLCWGILLFALYMLSV